MRIGLVSPRFFPSQGGVQTVVEHLARGLALRDCQVDVLTQVAERLAPARRSEWHEIYRVLNFVEITRSDRFPMSPGLWAHLACYSRRYDVLHLHDFHGSTAIAGALSAKAPIVFSPYYHGGGHTAAAQALHLLYRPLARRAFAGVDQMIFVSTAECAAARDSFPSWNSRWTVVSPGVEVDAIRSAEPFPSPTPVVLVAGRLVGYKQVDRVISAFNELGGDARLVIAGSGLEEQPLRLRVQAAALDQRVEFVGLLTDGDLRRWQRTASVVVSLSRHESYGLAVLEGIAAGAYIVATDIPAHREVRELAPNAVHLVDADARPAEIAAAIRRALSRASPPPAENLPTWDRAVDATLAVYKSAIDRRAASSRGNASVHQRR